MSKIDITKTELVWPGKYNEDGTRNVPSPQDPAIFPGRVALSSTIKDREHEHEHVSCLLLDTSRLYYICSSFAPLSDLISDC